nr:hypothetical protein [Luteimicrobium album]
MTSATTPVPTTTAPAGRAPSGRRRRVRPGRVALAAAAVVTILASVFPVYWMVRTALEPTRDLQSGSPTLWPRALTLDHFRTALDADGFWAFWRNSLFVTLGSVLVALVVAALAAFAVARLRWRGRGIFVLVVFAAQMAPWEALLIPMYIVVRDVDLLDRLVTLLVIYMVITLPFTILTIRGSSRRSPSSSRRRRASTAARAPRRSGASSSRCSHPACSRRRSSGSSRPGTSSRSRTRSSSRTRTAARCPSGCRRSTTCSGRTGARPWPRRRCSCCPCCWCSSSCRTVSPAA